MTDTICNENVQFNKLRFEISAETEARWLLNNAFLRRNQCKDCNQGENNKLNLT